MEQRLRHHVRLHSIRSHFTPGTSILFFYLAIIIHSPVLAALHQVSSSDSNKFMGRPSSCKARSCSCGSVQLHVNTPVLQIVHCHCAGCRKATGAAFSTWGCVPLISTYFSEWSSLKVHQRTGAGIISGTTSSSSSSSSSPRANRYFCSNCGCSVCMTYPATGRWPEPNSLWLSAAFLGEDSSDVIQDAAIHMYPEERPGWCTIDKVGCDGKTTLTYMGGEHLCVVRDDNNDSNDTDDDDDDDDDNYQQPPLVLGGRAGEPLQDPAALALQNGKGFILPPSESFRLRGMAPTPQGLPGSAALALKDAPKWFHGDADDDKAAVVFSSNTKNDVDETTFLTGGSFRVRTVEIAAAAGYYNANSPKRNLVKNNKSKISVSVFEVANPTAEDGCDLDSPRSTFCGGVLWPGSQAAAEALVKLATSPKNEKGSDRDGVSLLLLANQRVLEIGAGTGLVSLAAALLGAKEVIATDASTATLELIEAAAAAQDLSSVVRTQIFDLVENDNDDDLVVLLRNNNNNNNDDSEEDLVDFAVAADLLYSEELAKGVARACAKLQRLYGATIIVTDSQERHREDFLTELKRCSGEDAASKENKLEFEATVLGGYTGWSYADDSDVTVDEITIGVLII